MALKGTLKDFSLADILQLIGIQRKTGVLNLHGSEDMVSISFVQGTIVSAESAQHRLEDRVATVLMKWGYCTPDQLEDARQSQLHSLDRLWIILLQQESVSGDEVRQALRLQVEKIIYPVFRWQDGEYSFIQEPDIDFDRDHLTPIHSETVLMEGVRMLDEWPLLERKIRSEEMVFSRAPVGGQVVVNDDVDGVEQAEGNVIRMSGEEFSIYDLVDGVRTVADIQEIAPTHDFNTASILCNLHGLGMITPSGDGRSSTGRLNNGPVGKRTAPRMAGAALLCLVAAVVLAITVPRLQLNPLNIFLRDLVDSGRAARLNMLRDTTRLHMLVDQLNAYRLDTGSYPVKLTELAESGFTDQDEITDNDGEFFVYSASGNDFTLTAHPRPRDIPDLLPLGKEMESGQ